MSGLSSLASYGWLTLLVLLTVGGARAQGGDIVLKNTEGDIFSFPDETDPTRQVTVWIGGVEIAQGARILRGRSLVIVSRRGAALQGTAAGSTAASGQMIAGDQVLEVFLDGDVSLEEGDEVVIGAQSLLLDNTTGEITILDGEWRSTLTAQPLVVRYEVMRQLEDDTRELEGVSYSTCEYEHTHWSLNTPWARMVSTLEGRVIHTAGNTAKLGGLPVLWLPGFHMNVDRDRPPLRRLDIGTSRRFGTEISTTWGGDASAGLAALLGLPEKDVEADWEFVLANFSSRGVFYEPRLEYEIGSSKGEIFAAYIRDHNAADELGTPIEDNTRGRFDVQHRTEIDENRTVDVEISYISDRGFLEEYYENEYRTGKDQESYINYRDVKDNEAMQILTRVRLNDFEDRVEYLPEVERRLAGEAVDTGVFGPAFFTSRSFISHARLRGNEPPDPAQGVPSTVQPASDRALRGGTTGALNWPIDVGEDRLRVLAGYDLTGFDKHRTTADDPSTTQIDEHDNDEGPAYRYALTGAVEWSRTYSGVGAAQSELWNFDGVRQILEPRAGFASVLELNEEPEDLVLIDEVERDTFKQQRFFVGLRHRIQTHQQGDVATVLATDVSMPIYSNEERDNLDEDDPSDNGRTAGLITIDTTWKPGADIWGLRRSRLNWRARIDPNYWAYERSFLSFLTPIGPDRSIGVSHNRVRHVSNTLAFELIWVLTPKWTGGFFIEEDLREKESARRGIILRQQAHRWLFDIELSQRRGNSRVDRSDQKDDVRFSISIRPAFLQSDEESLLAEIGRVRTR